jgi:ubiquitin-conjugating enzyme E2 variant
VSREGYTKAYRAIEALGIVAFFLMAAFLGWRLYVGAVALPDHAWWVLLLAFFSAVLLADFISGLFHFLADNFGTEETLWVGPNVIGPFREHHVHPRAMCEHDFVETNGNSCLICLPAMGLVGAFIAPEASPWHLFAAGMALAFFFGILMTNQFHKWSHLEEPKGLVALLQRCRLILEPQQHDVHHTPPFDRYYCITTGWLNAPLDWIGFFPRLERFLRWATRSPRRP